MLLINPHSYHRWKKTRTCMQLVCRRVMCVETSNKPIVTCQHSDVALALKSNWEPQVTQNSLDTVDSYLPCATFQKDIETARMVLFLPSLWWWLCSYKSEMLDFIFLHNTCYNYLTFFHSREWCLLHCGNHFDSLFLLMVQVFPGIYTLPCSQCCFSCCKSGPPSNWIIWLI